MRGSSVLDAVAVPGASHAERRTRWRRLLPTGLAASLAVAVVLNLSLGAVAIPFDALVRALAGLAGPDGSDPAAAQDLAILTGIRLPRALFAALAGAGLAVTGGVLQGLFRNPLADPTVIGVSGGAALGAAVAIVGLGSLPLAIRQALGALPLPLCAFVGALSATTAVYHLGRPRSGASLASVLLAGIAVNAMAFAGVGALSVIATDEQLRNLTFWNLGSVGGTNWTQLMIAASLGVPAIGLMIRLGPALDALALGHREAGSLGIDVTDVRRRAVMLAALTVGAIVSGAGVIGFVGLLAPHMVRLAIGPAHRSLLPVSALLGALLLLVADLLARTIVMPAELPVGILTTAAGAPFFLWLLARAGRDGAP